MKLTLMVDPALVSSQCKIGRVRPVVVEDGGEEGRRCRNSRDITHGSNVDARTKGEAPWEVENAESYYDVSESMQCDTVVE